MVASRLIRMFLRIMGMTGSCKGYRTKLLNIVGEYVSGG